MKVLLALLALLLSCNGMSAHVDNSTPIVNLVEEPLELVELHGGTSPDAFYEVYGLGSYAERSYEDFRYAPYFYRLRWNAPLRSPRAVHLVETAYFPRGRTGWEAYKRERLILCESGTIESRAIPYSRHLSSNSGSRRIEKDKDWICTVRIVRASDTTHLWNHGLSWHYEVGTPAQLVFGELPQTAIEQPWIEQGD